MHLAPLPSVLIAFFLTTGLVTVAPAAAQVDDAHTIDDHSWAWARQAMEAAFARYQAAVDRGDMAKAEVYRQEYFEAYFKLYGKYPGEDNDRPERVAGEPHEAKPDRPDVDFGPDPPPPVDPPVPQATRDIVIYVTADGYETKTYRVKRPDGDEPAFVVINGTVRDSISEQAIDRARVVIRCGSAASSATADGGYFRIALDVNGPGEGYHDPKFEGSLDRAFSTTIRARAIGYQTLSTTLTFPASEMPNKVTVHGVVHYGDPIPGAEVTMDLWGGDTESVTTDKDGKFIISGTPFLSDPKRLDHEQEHNFAMSPSARLTATLEYRPVHLQTSAFGGHAVVLPNFHVDPEFLLKNIRLDGVPLTSGRLVIRQAGFRKGEREINYVRWRGGHSTESNISGGQARFTFPTPKSIGGFFDRMVDPRRDFPVHGRFDLEYFDRETREWHKGAVEYIVPSPFPIIEVEAPQQVLDDAEVDFSKTFRVLVTDWNENSVIEVSVKGNGDVFYYVPELRQMVESENVPFASSDPDGQLPTQTVTTFAFLPNKKIMDLTEYLEASGVDSEKLEQTLTYLAGETYTHPDFIDKMSSVAPNSPHFYGAGKYTQAALGNLETFAKNNPKVGAKIVSFLKENSHLKNAPGILAGVISGGELILTVTQAVGNEKLMQRIGRFELGDNFAEVNETVTTGTDLWVGVTDCAMFLGYAATVKVQIGWQALKALYAYSKYQNERVAKYEGLCKTYESFVYEPLLIVARDSEGNEVAETTQVMVSVTRPEMD